jgi:ankyrin repeat protein
MGRSHDKELYNAARKGHNPRVERLLREGANVDAPQDYGWTALIAAAYGGHLDVVVTLLNAGADVNLRANDGSALCWAASQGHEGVVRVLIRCGADVNPPRGGRSSLLHSVISSGHDGIAEMLIDAGADTDRGGYYHDESAYRTALRYRRDRLANYLRSKGLHR